MSSTEQAPGVHIAAKAAAERGVILMAKSLMPPFYAVPYPEFVSQIRDTAAEEILEDAESALMAIREHIGEAALQTVERTT